MERQLGNYMDWKDGTGHPTVLVPTPRRSCFGSHVHQISCFFAGASVNEFLLTHSFTTERQLEKF